MTTTLAKTKPINLTKLLEYWQGVLGLRHWKIVLSVTRGYDMGDSLGNINHSRRYHNALIRLLDPRDYDSDGSVVEYDVEHTLVHELCHLHFAAFDADLGSEKDVAEDQAVEAFTRALLAVKRGKS